MLGSEESAGGQWHSTAERVLEVVFGDGAAGGVERRAAERGRSRRGGRWRSDVGGDGVVADGAEDDAARVRSPRRPTSRPRRRWLRPPSWASASRPGG